MIRTAIDLFCGAGGLSEGFRQANFRVLAGNDVFEAAGRTYLDTHPEAEFFLRPIQDLSSGELLKKTGLVRGELDVLIGGPPCQAYSVYNHQRGLHDDRAGLFREYLRLVDGLRPKWVVMENVTGITSIGAGVVVAAIKDEFAKLGYRIESKILRAEEFGVPQERRRIFFIGTRIKAPIFFPVKLHDGLERPFTTIWDAIGDLPKIGNGEDRRRYR